MRPILATLFTGFDEVYDRLRRRLQGLTTEEYLWEPVPDCWSVRPVGATWRADGGPDIEGVDTRGPAPVTTIAWRLWHIGSFCLAEYVSPHLGEWPLEVTGTEWFAQPDQAITALDTAWTAFRERITGLGEHGLAGELGEQWGPFATSTWADLVVHALDEVAHHGAEIALLRDLYPRLGPAGAAPG